MLGLFLLSGCDKRPDNVLSDSEMVDLMTDLLLADAIEQSVSIGEIPDSVRRNLGESILKQHGVERATLDSTFSWYSRNLDDYYRLYAKVDKRLKKMKKSVNSGASETQIENNIWELPPYLRFSKYGAGDLITFTLPGETVGKGEELKWRMRFESGTSADIMIGIDYADGTSSYTRREVSGGKIELSVIADTVSSPIRVYGFIWPDRRNMPVAVDSISLVRLPYDSIAFDNARFKRKILPPIKKEIKIDKDSALIDAALESKTKEPVSKGSPALRQLSN